MIQFKLLPKTCQDIAMGLTDCIWIGFNIVMILKSIETIRNLTEFPFHSPALEWSMAYVYWIFPISFGLMIIRIIQVNIMIWYPKAKSVPSCPRFDSPGHVYSPDCRVMLTCPE